MLARDDILRLEERNFNAWPALKSVHYDGWLLRSTGGTSRRVNSVNPLVPGVVPLDEKIATAEAVYARWGREAIFRITPLAEDGLDQALAARGYVVDGPTFVQLAEATPFSASAGVQFFVRPDDTWIEAALRIRGLTGMEADAFATQHRAIGIDTAWALVRDGAEPVAVGASAIEGHWAGLHGIYVSRNARRQGQARRVSEALIGFARAKGARRVWLQVEQTNAAALPLYRSLGFRTAYAYHHRVQTL